MEVRMGQSASEEMMKAAEMAKKGMEVRMGQSASEEMMKAAQIEEHIEFKYRGNMQKLQAEMSQMAAQQMTEADDNAARQKGEQERADKYRAKYESVKQHVKTLEMQKTEYTRVNMQLRTQNNQFRAMITQLQKDNVALQGQQNQNQPRAMPNMPNMQMGGQGQMGGQAMQPMGG